MIRQWFLNTIPKAQMTKRIGTLDLITIKNFCASEDTSKKWRQPRKWEKIIANHISDKGLVSAIYNELL